MKVEQSLTTAGDRLRRARLLAGLNTRREFEYKHHISSNTLQGWEQNKNPLSTKGARRIIEALKKEGLLCSVEWLLHGSGLPPRPFEMINAGVNVSFLENHSQLNLREEEAIYQESQIFKGQKSNTIILNITDDAMEPYYALGDYIGGVQIDNSEIPQFLGRECIVELENNLILPRILQAGSHPNVYNLSCTNPKTTASLLNFYNAKVISAAPIVWHRRKLTSLRHQ